MWKPVTPTSTSTALNITSGWDFGDGAKHSILVNRNTDTMGSSKPIICNNYGESPCAQSSINMLSANIVFPVCAIEISNWCIKDVRIYSENMKPLSAVYVKTIAGPTVLPDQSIGLPYGSSVSIWKSADSSSNLEEIFFAVEITESISWINNQPQYQNISAQIRPVKILKGKYVGSSWKKDSNGGYFATIGDEYCKDFFYFDTGECGSEVEFPVGMRFGISIIVPNIISGFISGRLDKPLVSSSALTTDSKLFSVDGSPIQIPRFGMTVGNSNWPTKDLGPPTPGNGWVYQDNRQDGLTLKKFNTFRDLAKNKSSGTSTSWNFGNLSYSTTTIDGRLAEDLPQKCKIPQSDFLGAVSTNAMVFDPNPPQYIDGEFIYNVAGMHFSQDGTTITSGKYSLLVSKSLITCLYGNNFASVRATVSIISPEGEDSFITTETVRNISGYFVINVSGFHFSTPVIRVKFEVSHVIEILSSETETPRIDSSTVIDPSEPKKSIAMPTNSKEMSVKKKILITCIKGKITKKVSAVKPKCPAGYKKK